jgi:hypothetical protein
LLQLTAFLEVLHSALGLVHSSTLYNFLQWLGRSHVLFAIIAQIPEVQEQPPILITFSAWALSEVLFTFSSLYLYQALYSENSKFWVTSGVFEVFSRSSDDHYGCKFQGCMMLKHFIGLI